MFIDIQLTYKVVLISAVPQSDSAIHTCTFMFSSFTVYPKRLDVVLYSSIIQYTVALYSSTLFIHSVVCIC